MNLSLKEDFKQNVQPDGPTHVPVMVHEIESFLNLLPGCVYIDGTLGLGGHASIFVHKMAPEGWLVGMDWDKQMLEFAKENLQQIKDVHLLFYHDDFRSIKNVVAQAKEVGCPVDKVQAILLDLGLNNAQITSSDRGFSFKSEGPLDMRMDQSPSKETAADLLNRLSAKEIEDILFHYGDERWARRVAAVIVEQRKLRPLKTTTDLVDCVLKAIPAAKRERRIHPATRTFQAVRIAVNCELDSLSLALEDAANSLAPGGTLAVLSYHSGEDRIVKHTFKQLVEHGFKVLTKRPQTPTDEEIRLNPKSRSAKLRVLQRREEVKA